MAETHRDHMIPARRGWPFSNHTGQKGAGCQRNGAGGRWETTTMSCSYKHHAWGTYMAAIYNNTHAPRMQYILPLVNVVQPSPT